MGIIKIDKEELNKLIEKAKDKTSDVIGEDNLKKIVEIKNIAVETGNSIKEVINSKDDKPDIENIITEDISTVETLENSEKDVDPLIIDEKQELDEGTEGSCNSENNTPQNNSQFISLENINLSINQEPDVPKEKVKSKKEKTPKKINKKIIVIIVVAFVVAAIAKGIIGYIQEINRKVVMSHPSESYYGDKYSYVVSSLKSDGVTNIELVEIADLSTESDLKEECVEKVFINGQDTFAQDEEFPLNSIVKIYYHTTHKINCPYSSDSIQDKDVNSLVKDFSKAGFINISTSELTDLDPDEFNGEYQNEISIGNKSEFDTNDEFLYNENVSIIKHYPYNKFNVNININFNSNLIFSKFGINVYVNEECVKELEHGEDALLNLRLKEGKNTIRFVSDDDKTDYKEIEIDVLDDLDATYTLSTSSTFGLSATEDSLSYKTYLREGEIRMHEDISTFIGKNYNDVVDSIKLLGFTNITTTPKYDLDDGSSERENVSEVIFGKNKTYSIGDILQSDTAVEVVYHLTDSDKPESMKIQEAKDSLPLYVAQRAFQNMGDYTYPYGFKCHWILENYEETQHDDGSWFLKVGVTITNAFGAEVDAIAEAYIDNTNSMVRDFKVYDIH